VLQDTKEVYLIFILKLLKLAEKPDIYLLNLNFCEDSNNPNVIKIMKNDPAAQKYNGEYQ
jgi:hypothetical protein